MPVIVFASSKGAREKQRLVFSLRVNLPAKVKLKI